MSKQQTFSFATDEHIVPVKETHVKKLGIMHVPFTSLEVLENFNDREDYGTTEEMNELAESILTVGPKVPMKGYKNGNKYVVIVGHRRHRAGEMIMKKHGKNIVFPFLCYSPGTRKADMLLDTLLTNSGKDLTPLEKASTVSKLIEQGVPTKEIASALGGVSEVYVKNLQRLWTIPDGAKKLIRQGVISATLIMGVLKNKNANLEEFIAEVEKQAETEGSDKKGKKGSKKKASKITAKNAPKTGKDKNDSLKEFKRFMKQNPGTYKNKERQLAYEFFEGVVKNKVTYTDILEYFTGK